MNEPQTYSELKAAIAAWMIRDDLDVMIPVFIGSAERRFNRLLRTPEMQSRATVSVVSGVGALPAGFLQARSVQSGTNPVRILDVVGGSELSTLYPTSTGIANHYAVAGGNIMIPGGNASYTVDYYAKIPALSDDNPTNWLLTAEPDLYVAQAVAEAMAYTRDVDAADWLERANAKLVEIQQAARKKAFSSSPLVRRAPSVA